MTVKVVPKVVGTHLVALDGDVVLFTARGDFLLGDAQQLNAELLAILTRLGRVFVLADQTHAGQTPPEVRRYLMAWNKEHQITGAVILGGSIATRAMASLVLGAVRLLRPDHTPVTFAATEAEARAWIDVQRKNWLARQPPSSQR